MIRTPHTFSQLYAWLGITAIAWSMVSAQDAVSHGERPKWHSTAYGEFKAGEARQISQFGFTFPLRQDTNSLLFLDFRGNIDDSNREEYNTGFVFRKLIDPNHILGAYAYFDRQFSATGNSFDQITLGAEWLGKSWDIRSNVYLPITGTKFAGQDRGFGNIAFVRDQLFINSLQHFEAAYHGLDWEIGKLLAVFGEHKNELRLYGGAFYFDEFEDGFEHILGPRARIEMRLFDVDLLGHGSRVTFSGEIQHDQVRKTDGFAGVQIQIPLGKFSRDGRSPGVSHSYSAFTSMERRMLDPVVRDVDIVTNTKATGSTRELLNDPTNDPLFLASNEFSLGNALSKAGPNGTVVVSGNITTPGNAQMQNGQRLTSVTTPQTFIGATTGIRVNGPAPGRQGGISGSNTAQPVIWLANNVMVDHLEITGGSNGLASGGSVQGVTISNNLISGANQSVTNTGNGLFIGGDFSGIITNNVFSNNANDGLKILATNTGTITDNRSIGNRDEGYDVINNSGIISNNVAMNNLGNGFGIDRNSGLVTGNSAVMNQIDGFNFIHVTGTVSGNTATSNGDDGFESPANDSTAAISGNTAFGNFGQGFDFAGGDRTSAPPGINIGISAGTVTGNTAIGNFDTGFLFTFNTGTVSNNTASNSVFGDGFAVFINAGTISGNTASGNLAGFNIFANEGRLIANTANNNTFDGFSSFINEATGLIDNNTSSQNSSIGFSLFENLGTLSNNTANLNDFGYDIFQQNGTISNNTGTGNISGGNTP